MNRVSFENRVHDDFTRFSKLAGELADVAERELEHRVLDMSTELSVRGIAESARGIRLVFDFVSKHPEFTKSPLVDGVEDLMNTFSRHRCFVPHSLDLLSNVKTSGIHLAEEMRHARYYYLAEGIAKTFGYAVVWKDGSVHYPDGSVRYPTADAGEERCVKDDREGS